MAIYKYGGYLSQSHEAKTFDDEYRPGMAAPSTGIYRCLGCGREVVLNAGQTLPPPNHHSHVMQQGAVRWKLIVFADHRPA